jgi:peptidoglycan-N-acetylglucosamine deacetylase
VLRELGMINVNFSCRGMDAGNRWIKHLSKRILKRVRPGDIIALHDTWPGDDARLARWLHEVDLILTGITEKGIAIVPLSQLIGRPVMIRQTERDAHDRVESDARDGYS